MRPRRILIGISVLALFGIGGIVMAQRGRGRNSRPSPVPVTQEPQKITDFEGRAGVANWDVDKDFKSDLFTFVRIRYSDGGGYGGGRGFRGYGGRWYIDAPSSDLNFSFRLQQLTSLKVNPEPIVLDLSDPELFNYPFIYMLEIANLRFTDDEITCLRRYLLNGGFLMVDDHWGADEYENFHREIKRVFPDKEPTELPIEHPIFHCVFDLKQKPQIPGIEEARRHRALGSDATWERDWDPTTHDAHYRAIFDDNGRMMVIICTNTDLGDGWEREGEEEWYFHRFSEKQAYPMGINIVFYAMTH